jgi:dihydrofolate reductase
VLDARRKYVASTTLCDPLPWQNSTLLAGEAAAAVKKLKGTAPENDLVVLGSGELLRALLGAGLVDQLQLLLRPLVLGPGTRLFAADGPHTLALTDSVTTTTGVVIATYHPAAA